MIKLTIHFKNEQIPIITKQFTKWSEVGSFIDAVLIVNSHQSCTLTISYHE